MTSRKGFARAAGARAAWRAFATSPRLTVPRMILAAGGHGGFAGLSTILQVARHLVLAAATPATPATHGGMGDGRSAGRCRLAPITHVPTMVMNVVTIQQVGANVVATGSGEFDLSGLTLLQLPVGFVAGVRPGVAILQLSSGALDPYSGASGPTSFGQSGIFNASSSSGQVVAIVGDGEAFAGIPGSGLGVPTG
jgi:hypothetical protein